MCMPYHCATAAIKNNLSRPLSYSSHTQYDERGMGLPAKLYTYGLNFQIVKSLQRKLRVPKFIGFGNVTLIHCDVTVKQFRNQLILELLWVGMQASLTLSVLPIKLRPVFDAVSEHIYEDMGSTSKQASKQEIRTSNL